MLFANNLIEEPSIINNSGNERIYTVVVYETVFAIGYNKNHIIAKSYFKKKNGILYHIIEIKNELKQNNLNLSFENYKSKREELNLPISLNFNFVYQEITKTKSKSSRN